MNKESKTTEQQCNKQNVTKRFLVKKDCFCDLMKGEIYKECFSKNGKNTRYYTQGKGDIVFGNFSDYPDCFKLLPD
jgi:hypothetical protein